MAETLLDKLEDFFDFEENEQDDALELNIMLSEIMLEDDAEEYIAALIDGFYESIRHGKKNICRRLLHLPFILDGMKVEHNYDLKSALDAAVKDQHVGVLKELSKIPNIQQAMGNGFIELAKDNVLDEIEAQLSTFPKSVIHAENLDGMNALQVAIEAGNNEVVARLLQEKRFAENLHHTDIYGRTALDHAKQSNNTAAIELISRVKPLDTPDLSNAKAKALDIRQTNVITKLSLYLNQNARNTLDVMSSSGVCNGLAFLHQIYTSDGREAEFFDVLETIVQWNGKPESLTTHPLPDSLAAKYVNAQDLFEQTINDVNFFMHNSPSVQALGMTEWDQISRKVQYDLIKDPQVGRELVDTFSFRGVINKQQLVELLEHYAKYPGLNIDVAGANHATSLYISGDGNFHYYDPNVPYRVVPFETAEKAAEHIINYKYRKLGRMTQADHFDIELRCHRFYPANTQIPEMEKPSIGQPSSKADFTNNRFNDLHVAILMGDEEQIKALIKSQPKLLGEKDANGNTPLHLAMTNDAMSHETYHLIIKASKAYINQLNNDKKSPMALCIDALNDKAFNALVSHPQLDITQKDDHGKVCAFGAVKQSRLSMLMQIVEHPNMTSNDLKSQDLLVSLIQYRNLDGVRYLLSNPNIEANINKANQSGETPLLKAAENGDIEMVQFLIAQGVDVQLDNDTSDYGTLSYWAKLNPEIHEVLKTAHTKKAVDHETDNTNDKTTPKNLPTAHKKGTMYFSYKDKAEQDRQPSHKVKDKQDKHRLHKGNDKRDKHVHKTTAHKKRH